MLSQYILINTVCIALLGPEAVCSSVFRAKKVLFLHKDVSGSFEGAAYSVLMMFPLSPYTVVLINFLSVFEMGEKLNRRI